MSRRSARGQHIPPHEVEYLNSLKGEQLYDRVKALYDAGWSLQTLGDSLLPKHPRSTIRTWVQRATGQNMTDAPIPTPKLKTPQGGYQKVRPESPGIPQDDLEIIRQLAPLARSYRSRMAMTSAAAVANDRLTALCILQHQKGVSIKELAEAAGVTYRAMYKRIKL